MFVMLSVRTTSVSERHNNKVKKTTTASTATTTTTSEATNTQITQTTQNQDSAITSSLTTTFDNLLTNKISIEKIFTKSVSFDKNINQSYLSLVQPNNWKEPPTQQVIYFHLFSFFPSSSILHRNSIFLSLFLFLLQWMFAQWGIGKIQLQSLHILLAFEVLSTFVNVSLIANIRLNII